MIIVISGPSGVGKGTVTREIIKKDPTLKVAVTYTTRKPRNGEINGVDYYFISEKEYFDLLHSGSFAEYSIVHGNYYATPVDEINLGRSGKNDVIFQIDVQGGKKIRNLCPESLLIFLMPPSIDILLERLNIRGTENEEEKRKRIKRAIEEIAERVYYDYIIVNDDLNKTVEEILEIIKKERERRKI